jgi:hypothetical protein
VHVLEASQPRGTHHRSAITGHVVTDTDALAAVERGDCVVRHVAQRLVAGPPMEGLRCLKRRLSDVVVRAKPRQPTLRTSHVPDPRMAAYARRLT